MKVFVVAGEPSGDRLGGAVMAGLRQLAPSVAFEGVGGPEMAAQGLSSLFPMADLSVMGLAEILPRLRPLLRRIDQTVAAVVAARPDVLLTIDSPDFCLRVAARVRAAAPGIRIVHYVAPTVWAWRPGRAARMAPHVDQVLCLFPFEPPYMHRAGMAADFVGHPVVAEPQASEAEARAFRAETGGGPLILALPGSRAGEITRLADRFGAALAQVATRRPDARVVLPAAAPVVDLVRRRTAHWRPQPLILDPADDPGGARKRAAFRAADVALAASGTVALELAAAGTPMVVGYDLSWLTRQLARVLVRTDRYCLVNIVADTDAVPEFIGDACRADAMADALLATLADPAPQRAAMALTIQRLGQGADPPGLRAARAILARPGRPALVPHGSGG